MIPTPNPAVYTRARRHLSRRDPILKAVMAQVGRCTLAAGGDPFIILVRSIVSQLISTKAAISIFARIQTAAGEKGVTPAGILEMTEETLRSQGLSGTKTKAIRDLAQRAQDGRLPLDRLHDLADEEIHTHLTDVHGIGTWTAEMFLIFGLGRLDVLPVGDLGLRAGVQTCYSLEELPRPAKLREIAEVWAPYRSIATWYMWRSRGVVPQS